MIVREDIVSPWKDLLASPEVARTVIAQASMIVGLLLVCLIAYLLGMRVARGLGEAIASRRPAAPEAAMGMGLPPGQAAFPAGGPPTMGDLEGAPQEALRLPYQPHFSCLTSKPIHEVVRVLEAEPPEDIAMALTWLADRAPEVGAKLFAALSEPFRLQVSRAMAGISQADPERISLLDSKLKTQVEFSIRGTEKLSKLLGPMPREQREGLLRNHHVRGPRRHAGGGAPPPGGGRAHGRLDDGRQRRGRGLREPRGRTASGRHAADDPRGEAEVPAQG
jgi:hypothetical protein